MLPSWRSKLRLAVSPDRVAVVRIEKGWRPSIDAKHIYTCAVAAAGTPLWQPALAALNETVREFGGKPADVTVILSNHFTHYALVPASAELDNDDEEMAFVRHCFSGIYGRIADDWSLHLCDGPRDEFRVAAAVDRSLLDAIRETFLHTPLRLRSIQPFLVTAFNRCRRQIAGQTAWLVAVEHAKICVALLRDNRWCSIRTIRVGDDWIAQLPVILGREAQLAGVQADEGQVWLFAPEHAGAISPEIGTLPMQQIRPAPRRDFSPLDDARFAMAMDG